MMKQDENFNLSDYQPETHALSLGYDPSLSEWSVKPPAFLTSTFQFASAEDGKRFFELAYGLKERKQGEDPGLIYSRINNPNLQIFEERISAWDQTEKGSIFSSGMAAISTTFLSLLSPGDSIITTSPIYGGTHFLFENILPKFGITIHTVSAGDNTIEEIKEILTTVDEKKIKAFYIETPANPSNALVDIEEVSQLAQELSSKRSDGDKILTIVDNTFLGPVFQRPVKHGADLIIYSATKFIGGHSDIIAGVVTGQQKLIDSINVYRTIMGTMATPFTGWLLLRSLETLSVRMRRQAKSAKKLAKMLNEHPKVRQVNYPDLLEEGSKQFYTYKKQCSGSGSLIAFEIDGGEAEAFKVLNSFKICRLAVSLGGTESLVEHPMSMTHSDVPPELLESYGVKPGVIRMSVGIEHESDIKKDILQALETI
jgi:methionine-gamma-lyase